MRDRRSAIVPPEMTNGSTSGSASSNSSARAIRIGKKVEKMQLAAASLQCARGLTIQHHGDETVARLKDQRVGILSGMHHVTLKVVVEAGIHQLHGEADIGVRADALRYLAEPTQDLLRLTRELISRERRREILLEE